MPPAHPARIALCAIQFYQRYLSPFKGFCCAYRVHTGHGSCSALGARAIRRHGLVSGIALLRRRMALCGAVHRRHAPAVRARMGRQAGACDCALPDLPCHGSLWDWLDCVNCCNVPGSCDHRRKASREEKYVYIPPNSRFSKAPRVRS